MVRNMSIYDYLNEDQIDKIISVISRSCYEAEKKEVNEKNRISEDIYKRLKKGRKAHDLTGDIYVSFFYNENAIDGLKTEIVDNVSYAQPELSNDRVVVHIYHKSNRLESKLIKDTAKSSKHLFCIRYDHDKSYRLKSIEAVDIIEKTKEILYERPKLRKAIG